MAVTPRAYKNSQVLADVKVSPVLTIYDCMLKKEDAFGKEAYLIILQRTNTTSRRVTGPDKSRKTLKICQEAIFNGLVLEHRSFQRM